MFHTLTSDIHEEPSFLRSSYRQDTCVHPRNKSNIIKPNRDLTTTRRSGFNTNCPKAQNRSLSITMSYNISLIGLMKNLKALKVITDMSVGSRVCNPAIFERINLRSS